MEKITSLFTYNKVVVGGGAKTMVCINNNTFVSATWLAKEAKLPIHLLSLLIGSSIDVTYFIKEEELTAAVLDDKGKVITPAVVCTEDNKVVKSFNIQLGFDLMCAMLKAA